MTMITMHCIAGSSCSSHLARRKAQRHTIKQNVKQIIQADNYAAAATGEAETLLLLMTPSLPVASVMSSRMSRRQEAPS
jgi:type II secretory pathway component PulM